MALGFDFGELLGTGGGYIGLGINFLVYGFLAVLVLGILYYFFAQKRKWNLDVEIKIPRSDGKMLNAEWGKGRYDAKRGVVFVKRKGIKKSALRPFDVKKYIQGTRTITVVQNGINEYLPVLQSSYLEMVDEETGEEAALMKTSVDMSESRAWRSQFEREAKQAYSIESILTQFLPYVGWGLILFLNFLGFSILYSRINP